jgi:hypothetical protein
MFYCDSCRDKNDWPDGLMKSFGPCECCGTTDRCSDVPGSQLPMPAQHEPSYFDEVAELYESN